MKTERPYRKRAFIIFFAVLYAIMNAGGWFLYIVATDAYDLSVSESLGQVLTAVGGSIDGKEPGAYLEREEIQSIAQRFLFLDSRFRVRYDSMGRYAEGEEFELLALLREGLPRVEEGRPYVAESYERGGEYYKSGIIKADGGYLVVDVPASLPARMLNLKKVLYGMGVISFLGLAVLWIILDRIIRSMVRSREALLVRDRLAALGELSGGVAHEIRNPLNIISATCDLLNRSAGEEDTRERRLIAYIEEEVKRIDRIVGNFLRLCRGQEKEIVSRVDFNEQVESVIESEEPLFRRNNVDLTIRLDSAAGSVPLSEEEASSVIRNLLQNAVEAIGLAGGRILVQTRREGERVVFRVEDDGGGIPSGERDRIFDPFYTTRDTGMGLGLSLVRGIVQGVGGEIEIVDSSLGGTGFEVILPRETGGDRDGT